MCSKSRGQFSPELLNFVACLGSFRLTHRYRRDRSEDGIESAVRNAAWDNASHAHTIDLTLTVMHWNFARRDRTLSEIAEAAVGEDAG